MFNFYEWSKLQKSIQEKEYNEEIYTKTTKKVLRHISVSEDPLKKTAATYSPTLAVPSA